MRRSLFAIVLAALGAAGWYVHQHFDIEIADGALSVRPKSTDGSSGSFWGPGNRPLPVARRTDAIRIASFNIQVFGEQKASKPEVMHILTDVLRQFDVVAVQEIRSKNPDVLPKFVAQLNAEGRHYDFVIGERQGRTDSKEQYAYIYDTQTIEIDRGATYSVRDPDNLMHRPPLVAAFRVRGPPPDQAFTFTLINIHTDPDEVEQELNVLDDIYRSVRSDGRGEDDVMLLGDFNADDKHFAQLSRIPDILWVISDIPTNTRGTEQYDNILFQRRATSEFTGMAGVVDLMTRYNLTQAQALEVSDHLPVWAEFSVYEGATSGHVASQGGNQQK